MKRSTIFIITVLMSIALGGLATFQVLHVRELLSIHQKQFDADVMQSLHETAASLENREAAEFITDDMLYNLDSLQSVTALLNDSLNLLIASANSPHVKIIAPGQTFKYQFRKDSLGFSQQFEFNSEKDLQHSPKALAEAGAEVIQLNTEELKDRVNKKEKQLSIVVKKLEKESIRNSIHSRIDTSEVEKTLTTSLQNRGIKIPFRYAVVNGENDSVVFSSDSSAAGQAKESIYTTQLFPNDIIPGNNFLKVWFPQKSSFLFSLTDMSLFSSFIFILIVLFCFAYTLVILIKQKKLSDMKSDFINNMTHELKTPIATISVATEVLNDMATAANETQVKYYSGIIRQENERMNAQVERVLQLARLDRKEMQLNKEIVNIHKLIHDAAVTFRMQVEKSSGTLAEELAAERPVLQADALHISNVIHNLLDNAKKYSPENPDVKIKTWSDDKGLFLAVSDKGIGMNKETLKRIFDKFYRATHGNIHDVKGFGIGLSYVKEIVELHGGRIQVESVPGAGSTFTIFLPFE